MMSVTFRDGIEKATTDGLNHFVHERLAVFAGLREADPITLFISHFTIYDHST